MSQISVSGGCEGVFIASLAGLHADRADVAEDGLERSSAVRFAAALTTESQPEPAACRSNIVSGRSLTKPTSRRCS